jgi:diacylglycerol O-acyltransferase
LALKVSQAMVDGADGLATILTRLVTVGPHDDPASYLPPEPGLGRSPSLVDLVTDTAAELTGTPFAGARLAGEAVPALLRTVVKTLRGDHERRNSPVPRTVFNDPLTRQREVAFSELRRADIDAVADALDVSADDVFLAACTLSLRT